MGWIRKRTRELTDAEREVLGRPTRLSALLPNPSANMSALEFDIGIDEVTKFVGSTPNEETELYTLTFARDLHIGFEIIFMRESTVSGRFPTDRLLVAFAIYRDSTLFPDTPRGPRWPLSYQWLGRPLDVMEVPYEQCPEWVHSLRIVTYIPESLEEALQQFTTQTP